MKIFITLLFAGIFTNNIITANLLGINSLHYSKSKGLSTLLKSGGILTTLLLASTAVTYPVLKWVLSPLNLGYLSPLVCIILVSGLLFAVYFLSEKFLPKLYSFLQTYFKPKTALPIILGLCLLNMGNEIITSYPVALLYSVITGLGFTVTSVIFASLYKRLQQAELPDAVKGLPLTLIIAALISLAFGGFAGI